MDERFFRLIIDNNGKRSVCDCSTYVDIHTSFIQKPRYDLFGLTIPSWMKDMLGDKQYQVVVDKIEDMASDLYCGRDGMEITIKI